MCFFCPFAQSCMAWQWNHSLWLVSITLINCYQSFHVDNIQWWCFTQISLVFQVEPTYWQTFKRNYFSTLHDIFSAPPNLVTHLIDVMFSCLLQLGVVHMPKLLQKIMWKSKLHLTFIHVICNVYVWQISFDIQLQIQSVTWQFQKQKWMSIDIYISSKMSSLCHMHSSTCHFDF